VLSGSAPSTADAEKIAVAIGNTKGVTQVANNITAEKKETAATIYTVKEGDSLWKIAEAVYGHGHGSKSTQIFEANRPMLSNPDKIYPGQALRIPGDSVASAQNQKKGDDTVWKAPTT
jgi:nucleoid-associated protein YgaU